MSGTMALTEDLCWMPPGWFYDPILERMATRLAKSHPELHDTLLISRTFINGGFLDLRKADINILQTLLAAARETEAEFVAGGAKSVAFPEAFDGFMKRLAELVAMLEQAIAERSKQE